MLLIRPSALGDVARTVPVAAALRRRFPGATLDWLVQEGFEDAVRAHPAVSRVVTFPRRGLGRSLKRGDVGALLAWCGGIRGARYDTVIDAQGLLRSALIARASGAKVIIGDAAAREGAALLYTRRVRCDAVHTVDRMMSLVEAIGTTAERDMRLYVPAEARSGGEAADRGEGAVVLAPTSRWPAKRWPAERFAELARRLLDGGAARVLVIGGPGEREQCGPLLELARGDGRVVDLVGSLSVGGMMAAIAEAVMVVANDSAAAHVAVGFGRPLVALYGPTDVARVGPYGGRTEVLQRREPGERADHKRAENVAMMGRISVDEAWAACARVLADRPANAPAGVT